MSDDFGEHSDNKKVSPDQEYSQGCLQDNARWINVDFTEATPEIGDHHQCTPDKKRPGLDFGQSKIVPGKEERLTLRVNSRAKHNAETKDQKLDSPLHRANGRPKGFLEIHQNQDRSNQEKEI